MQNSIAKTLFIPLVARINCSEKFPKFFLDKTAQSLKSHIPKEFLKISSQYEMIASASRYHETDILIGEFIKKFGVCNVVNLGCGLETLAFRFSGSVARFYGVDLAEVIKFRANLLPQNDNETLISGDMFDMKWADKIDKTLPTIFVANGVFMYFYESQILNLIENLKANFKNSELIFDATTKFGIACANFYVSRFGKDLAKMHFFIKNPSEFSQKCGCKLIGSYPFFREVKRILWDKINFVSKFNISLVNRFDLSFIVHLNLR